MVNNFQILPVGIINYLKCENGGWRDGSLGKNTDCSSEDLGFYTGLGFYTPNITYLPMQPLVVNPPWPLFSLFEVL